METITQEPESPSPLQPPERTDTIVDPLRLAPLAPAPDAPPPDDSPLSLLRALSFGGTMTEEALTLSGEHSVTEDEHSTTRGLRVSSSGAAALYTEATQTTPGTGAAPTVIDAQRRETGLDKERGLYHARTDQRTEQHGDDSYTDAQTLEVSTGQGIQRTDQQTLVTHTPDGKTVITDKKVVGFDGNGVNLAKTAQTAHTDHNDVTTTSTSSSYANIGSDSVTIGKRTERTVAKGDQPAQRAAGGASVTLTEDGRVIVTISAGPVDMSFSEDQQSISVSSGRLGAGYTKSEDGTETVSACLGPISGAVTTREEHTTAQGDGAVQGRDVYYIETRDSAFTDYALSATFKKVLTIGVNSGTSRESLERYGRLLPADAAGWTAEQWKAWEKNVARSAPDLDELGSIWKMPTGAVIERANMQGEHFGVSLSLLFLRAGAQESTSDTHTHSLVRDHDGTFTGTAEASHTEGRTATAGIAFLASAASSTHRTQLSSWGFEVIRETEEAGVALKRFAETGLLPGVKQGPSLLSSQIDRIAEAYEELEALRDGLADASPAAKMIRRGLIEDQEDTLSTLVRLINDTLDIKVGDEPVPGIRYNRHVVSARKGWSERRSGWLVEDHEEGAVETHSVETYIDASGETERRYHFSMHEFWSDALDRDVTATADTDEDAATPLAFTSRHAYRRGQHSDDFKGKDSVLPHRLRDDPGALGYSHVETRVALDQGDLETISDGLNRSDKNKSLWPEMAATAHRCWTHRAAMLDSYWDEVATEERRRQASPDSPPRVITKPALLTFLERIPSPSGHEKMLRNTATWDRIVGKDLSKIQSPWAFKKRNKQEQMTFIASVTMYATRTSSNSFDALAAVSLIEDKDDRAKTYVYLVEMAKKAQKHSAAFDPSEFDKSDIASEWEEFQERRLTATDQGLVEDATRVDLVSDRLQRFRREKNAGLLAKYLKRPEDYGWLADDGAVILDILRAAREQGRLDRVLDLSTVTARGFADRAAGSGAKEEWIVHILQRSKLGDDIDLLVDKQTGRFIRGSEARDAVWKQEATGVQQESEAARRLRVTLGKGSAHKMFALIKEIRGDGGRGYANLLQGLKDAGITGKALGKLFASHAEYGESLRALLGGAALIPAFREAVANHWARRMSRRFVSGDAVGLCSDIRQAHCWGVAAEAAGRARVSGKRMRRLIEESCDSVYVANLVMLQARAALKLAGLQSGLENPLPIIAEKLGDAITRSDRQDALKWLSRGRDYGLSRAALLKRARKTLADLEDIGVPRWMLPY